MKKKIHPLSVVFIIVGILGIAFAGFCVYNQQIPGGLIVMGCSVVMFVFPGMLNKPAEHESSDYEEQQDIKNKPVQSAKPSKPQKSMLLGEFVGRCRLPDKSAHECILRVSNNRLDFVTQNGSKIVGMLRESVQDLANPNSHTIVITISSGEYRFICNDGMAIRDIIKLMTKK